MLRSLGTLATTARALRRARPRDVVVVAVPSRSSLRLGARRATSGVPSVPHPSPHSAHAPHPSTGASGGVAVAPEGPPDWASRTANWVLEHPGALAGTLVLVLIGWITHGKLDMDARKKAIESIDASQPIAPEEFRQITESNRLTVAEFLDLVEVAKAAFPDGVAFADEFLAIMARGIARERHPRGLRGLVRGGKDDERTRAGRTVLPSSPPLSLTHFISLSFLLSFHSFLGSCCSITLNAGS